MSPPVFDAADARFEVGGFEPQYLVIYADYSHWWQRIWARLTRRMVLWAGPVLPPDAIGVLDLDADTIKVVWDSSGRLWVVPDARETRDNGTTNDTQRTE